MKKKILFTILSVLLIPTIVNASSDVTVSINCTKDVLKKGETTSCELTANSSKEYNQLSFDLVSDSLEFLNKQGTNGFTRTDKTFTSSTNITGEVVFGTFDIIANNEQDTYIYVSELIAKDSNNTVLSTNTPVKAISIKQDEYTYEFDYDESTETGTYTIYKNGSLLPSGNETVLYSDAERTHAISTSLTNSFSSTYLVTNNQDLYGKTVISGTSTNFVITTNIVHKPDFIINPISNGVEIVLLNNQDNITYKLYRNNVLLTSNTDTNLENGKTYTYKYVASDEGITKETTKTFTYHEAPTFTISEPIEGYIKWDITPTDNVKYYYIVGSLSPAFDDYYFAAMTEEPSYVAELPMNDEVYYTVFAEYTDGVKSGRSNIQTYTNVELPITDPTNVKAELVTSTNPIGIKVSFTGSENADGYLIMQGDTQVANTKSTSYTIKGIKYGVNYSYKVLTYRCATLDCTEKVTTDGVQTNTVKATPVKQTLTITSNGRYDQNKLVISKPTLITAGTNTITYQIYRAKAGSSYALVKTINNAPVNSAYTYLDTISGAVINSQYYYKVVVKVDSATVTLDIRNIKAIVTAPTITSLINNTNATQQLYISNRGANIRYEVYQATSKKGKYKKKCDGTATTCNLKSIKWNKTYYYKVRAYYTLNGKKTYTGYSSIVSRKMTAISLDKLPLTYKVNGTNDIIKSVTVTKSGSKFSFKIKHTQTSTKAQTVKYKVRVYNYNKSQYKDVWLSVKLKKAKNKTYTTTVKVAVPNWATQYDFM